MSAWSTDAAGLPVYSPVDRQAALTECRKQARAEDQARLRLGAVASAVSQHRVYGDQSLKQFAQAAKVDYTTLHDRKRVYERLAELEISERSEILERLRRGSLYYSWLLVTAAVEDDDEFVEILRQARSTQNAKDLAGKPLHRQHVQTLVEKEEAMIDAAEQTEKKKQPKGVPRVRLHHGDCLEVLDQIEEGSIDAIVSDIPYGIKNEGGFGVANHGKIANDESPEENIEFFEEMLDAVIRVAKPDAHFLFGVSPQIRISSELMRILAEAGLSVTRAPLVWDKTRGNRVPGEPFQRHHELWLHAYRGQPKKWPHMGHGDVLRYPTTPGLQRYHHHMKPLSLMLALLEGFVPRGGRVLDPCAGSGSTLVAADLLDLEAIGIEIDPRHYRTADERLQRVRRAPEALRQKWLDEARESGRAANNISRDEVERQMFAALEPDLVSEMVFESTLRHRLHEASLTDEDRRARGEYQLFACDDSAA